MAEEDKNSLIHTPTWIIAVVCAIIVLVSLTTERGLHHLGKEGTKLEWRWRCKPSPDTKKTMADILDFLMNANIRLSEEVVRETQSFERLQEEAEKCLEQSEKLSTEKQEFVSEVHAKEPWESSF